MQKIDLCGRWVMNGNGFECEGEVPGSVYSFLLSNGLMEDPHYRTNELAATRLLEHDYTFKRVFDFDGANDSTVYLHCDGLDTLCSISLNGKEVAKTNNMHRSYEFDITQLLCKGENELSLTFDSPNNYIKKQEELYPIGVNLPDLNALIGYPHMRKAACMFGWDWGARLPDAGIWRNIYLLVEDSARINDVRVTQRHNNGSVYVTATADFSCECESEIILVSPSGEKHVLQNGVEQEVNNPVLWWPNGFGDQPLYTVEVKLYQNGLVCDSLTKRIGLRTIKLIRKNDKYGQCFYHEVNGKPIFAKGANFVPEDNILSRITKERTKRLLSICRDSHFNIIRVWGGGYYCHDWFYDMCDEMGILISQDLMFACSVYRFDDEMKANVISEITENLTRIRHHACLAMICGNNEIEMQYGDYHDETYKQMYLEMFEDIVPTIISRVCPEIDYVSSSPTTCGHFVDTNNGECGSTHYWETWFGDKPFTDYRNHHFRYLSEFGFQSFPSEKTVNAFTEPADRNIFSRVMEMHQRCGEGNGKIMNYLSKYYKYPTSFGILLYASQLLQMESIRYGVEHFRRHRGRCMGTIYWQINDIWPVASWSSIDYFGRLKALQYAAKRFYAPVLISCRETGETDTRPVVTREPDFYDYSTKAELCVTNDTLEDINGTVCWELRNYKGEILESEKTPLTVEALSAKWLPELDFNKTDVLNNYMSYSFVVEEEEISSGTILFTAPKHFNFINPNLKYEIRGNEITVFAESFAKSVEIYSPDSDFVLSDNYFDMNAGSKTVMILEGEPKTIVLRSVFDIE